MIPARRWPRRLLLAANVVVAFSLLASGAVYGYVRYRLDSIQTKAAPHLTKDQKGAKDRADGLAPENILLIGNQTRAGLKPSEIAAMGNPDLLSGSLSDVIMIAHLDPARDSVSILSIPRDLFVPMPAGSPVGPYQKIDAALNDGVNGPDNLIQAITNDLGIPINHYIELKFDGLQNVVNALGGIHEDFPERVYDLESGLNIQTTGCVALNGAQALALVRARHLQYAPPGTTSPVVDWPYDPESDLSRIARDHVFLRVLASTAISQGLTNPLKLNAFLGAIINQLIMDPGLKNELVKVAAHYRHVNPNTVPELTLPITTVSNYHYGGYDIGDVDFPVQPADNQVIAQWDGDALPAPTAPTVVDVHNLAGTYNLATNTAAALKADGLNTAVAGDTPIPGNPTETLIEYPLGSLAQAVAVSSHLSGAFMLQPDTTLPAGTIDLQAGSLLSVIPPASTSTATTATPASTSPAPTSTTVTTVPTFGGQKPSTSSDQLQPWDPTACPAK